MEKRKTWELETERLLLRRFEEKDKDALFEYLSDPETVKYEPYLPLTKEALEAELKARIASEKMIAVEKKKPVS